MSQLWKLLLTVNTVLSVAICLFSNRYVESTSRSPISNIPLTIELAFLIPLRYSVYLTKNSRVTIKSYHNPTKNMSYHGRDSFSLTRSGKDNDDCYCRVSVFVRSYPPCAWCSGVRSDGAAYLER